MEAVIDRSRSWACSHDGQFDYWETIQKQGYTNKGFIMGDWIGREAKGGQAWLTYHLSANEWVQLEYLQQEDAEGLHSWRNDAEPVQGKRGEAIWPGRGAERMGAV